MPSLTLREDPLQQLSVPLKTMRELEEWKPAQTDFYNISSIPLAYRWIDSSRPRLILTHDMAGGYVEDTSVQGNFYSTIYNIQYWHFVDMFIYFSHHRVSIPPVNWINACHRNGVKCLGTFLVEGDQQMSEMELLLGGPLFVDNDNEDDPMRLWSPYFADKLVAIAKHYRFDGWLFNIECIFYPFPIAPQFKASELAKFLNYLTHQMHKEVPGSQIIWYDSMTIEGDIRWQNQLNEKNELFFMNSDGIFLNYWWKGDYPEKSHEWAEKKGRSGLDIYFGTDVWGRHTYGDGGFDSYKGVKTSSLGQTSSSLFGMAWTYEHFRKIDFNQMDYLFWYGGYTDIYPPSPPTESIEKHKKGIADSTTIIPVPGRNWFVTHFNTGYGLQYYQKGKVLISQPWSHLSHQSVLPNLNYRQLTLNPPHQNTQFTSSIQAEKAIYTGGTSLLIEGQKMSNDLIDSNIEIIVPLYQLMLDVTDGCRLKYIYQSLFHDDTSVSIICHFNINIVNSVDRQKAMNIYQLVASEAVNDGCDIYLAKTCLSFSAHNQLDDGWIISTIEIPSIPIDTSIYMTMISMKIRLNTKHMNYMNLHSIISVGYLSIIPLNKKNMITQAKMDICVSDYDIQREKEDRVAYYCTLRWTASNNAEDEWDQTDYYSIYYSINNDDNRCFLGTSFSTGYRLSGLIVPATDTVYIQVESLSKKGDVINMTHLTLPPICT
ncbi:glycosyl hydrolase family 85-domain-containing protein [Pilobolus umbonatus]|nr:glycosyl hydrolase family 85-domain-containing protein [Pilobolus umbonatus]